MIDGEIRLRIFSDEGGCWKAHFKSWNNGNLQYKNIQVVEDDSYTHVVVYNLFRLFCTIKPIPKENVVAFITEPYETYNLEPYQDYARQFIGTYYCHDNSKLDRNIFKNGVPYLGPYCGVNQMVAPGPRERTMSIIASSKNYFPGHQLRHHIIRKILNSKLPIDIFGRGVYEVYGRGDTRIRGELEDKKEGLIHYKFTIAIENLIEKFWVTEKFYDPLLLGCLPIYWGASGINLLYPDKCFVGLPNKGSVDTIFQKITEISNNHHAYNFSNVEAGQTAIRERQNLPEFLWRHFNNVR